MIKIKEDKLLELMLILERKLKNKYLYELTAYFFLYMGFERQNQLGFVLFIKHLKTEGLL